MNTLTIALCDDDHFAADTAAAAIRSFFAEHSISTHLEVFYAADRLLSYCERTATNLVFLDIEMPELDGIRLGGLLKQQDFTPEIIFISNREDKVFSALQVHPFGFVRKNQFLKDIHDVLESYLTLCVQRQSSQRFLVATPEGRRNVDITEVEYFEGSGTYQMMYMVGSPTPVRVASRMKTLEESLSAQGFMRIHKGYLVNFRAIRSIQTAEVTLKSGKSLPISRGKAQEMQTQYLTLCRENGMMLF